MQAQAISRLYDEGQDVKNGKRRDWILTLWCLLVLAVGTFITVAGVRFPVLLLSLSCSLTTQATPLLPRPFTS